MRACRGAPRATPQSPAEHPACVPLLSGFMQNGSAVCSHAGVVKQMGPNATQEKKSDLDVANGRTAQ